MNYIIGIIGLVVFLLLAWVMSSDKKSVRWQYIGIMMAIQFLFAFLLLKTSGGIKLVEALATGFGYLLGYAEQGVNFVFGGLENPAVGKVPAASTFFMDVLLPITFISALIGILQYLKILPFIIKYLGWLISKVNGMGKLESFNAVAAAILGQSEVFISIKKQLPYIPKHRLYTLTASAMSTVSLSIVGAYFTMIEPKYVVTAIILNLFGGFIVASIINPYVVSAEEEDAVIMGTNTDEKKQSFFEMLGEYILDGFKVAVIVAAMLIGYIALIAMLNGIVDAFTPGEMNFQTILGYLFAPLAFLTGIAWDDAVRAGSIMATKLVSNEFVAMLDIQSIVKGKTGELSEHAIGIVSVFLVSFANFSSIGIIAGAIKSLNNEQGDVVARFGLKLLYGATLVSFISATIAGFFL
ncbi:NupC/NupG family nucleoside CNT transporter [Macrococcoides bohemicum]|uniref:NupC/NupG family nucleoside CNT transporter n=1 Tax=Macrococcoides bohemicum TaxID=1903056 RepID=A0AAE7QB19_9STAP|nr:MULTISPECIES: NupC/NupG family nucleoside CNT transporter [Macrococcus]ATD31718.1 nucleoside permease [Macrococcus sp. IME1552]QRN50854.1 NupC/NupG family nucleoside CNT transporter [Macrococcus bohemicus]QYA42305.1 NupC/NupG family nucleoside CNT transporter [Macrococcus bohemicus]QYA44696.1 NupC/NupG family nucleoside CNT transporter [Macrococcus bohemicus]